MFWSEIRFVWTFMHLSPIKTFWKSLVVYIPAVYDLTGANLTRANLTGANLPRATLTGVYLIGADLTGFAAYI